MVKINIRGREVDIDEECFDLVRYFNGIGLDTKFCCCGHGNSSFEIMFEDYIEDKKIEQFLLLHTKEFGFGITKQIHTCLHGKFSKWGRIVSGQMKYNWIYRTYNISQARVDYKRIIADDLLKLMNEENESPQDYIGEMKENIHDCYYDIKDCEPSEEEINQIYEKLPLDIKNLAKEWGGFDTEVREKIYVWIKEEK